MVKYLALAAVLMSSLVLVDVASARGHRGCASCGCAGGVCYAPAPVPVKAAGAAPASTVVAATATPAPTYYASNVRRGLFGWRR